MGAGVATVGRRPYAVGLYWENSPSGRVSQAAKEAARQPGQQAEFFAVRAGNKGGRIPQFGLSPAEAGHKTSMPVFAACLANQQPGSWAGAFRLREGTVVTIVRDDLIVPDGDQFFMDESEARDRLLQEIGFGGLQRIYAPEAWAIPSADTMPISLLMNEHTEIKLRPLRLPKKFVIMGVLLALLLVLAIGVGWYFQVQEAAEEQAKQAQQDRLNQLLNEAKSKLPGGQPTVQYPPPERKWEDQPHAMEVIDNCVRGLSKMPAAISGWHLSDLSCDGRSLSANWSREQGFSAPPKSFAIDLTGSRATFTLSLTALKPRGHEDLPDPVDVTRRYLAQSWPGSINRIPDDPPPPPPPNYQGEWNPPPPPWVKRSFTVTVPVLPWNSPIFFSDLQGTIVTSLKNAGTAWTIEGVIYENRK